MTYIIKNQNVKTHIERKYITHQLLEQGWEIIGVVRNNREVYFEDARLDDNDFIDFCDFEFRNNKEWFEGYTSWSDADHWEVIKNNIDELWDLFLESI